jgi:hypothetical protein
MDKSFQEQVYVEAQVIFYPLLQRSLPADMLLCL